MSIEYKQGFNSAINTAWDKGIAFVQCFLNIKNGYLDKYTPAKIADYWAGYSDGIKYAVQEKKRFPA